jgi:DNA (cytosine-5)-methyltransferase 1
VRILKGCPRIYPGEDVTGGFTFLGKNYPRTGFDIVKAYDINPHAVATYNANLEPVCEVKDVTTLGPDDLPRADVVLGGFPCQDFSVAGKRQGIKVQRGNLYKALVSAVEAVRPKVFVAENVKGLLTANGGLAIRVIAEDFAKAGPGYRIHMALLNAAHFGVPQRRERVFIVGVRQDLEGEFLFPQPTHAPPLLADGVDLLPWVTARDALHDLEDESALRSMPNWEWSKARKNRGQGNRPIKADEPAPTIRAEHHGNLEFHYALPRRLSVREAARLQSFPDTFVFHASMSEAYRLVGNAVPPVLAWHLAVAVGRFLDGSQRRTGAH